ncbi:MAG TPA: hypothetical protein VLA00_05300 [Xanthobacteraceae bacterium]|nr:hypothetical protein [Xanthobacteraceae bacterium]
MTQRATHRAAALRAVDSYPRHRLHVEADADPGALLRLLEPFAVCGVMPARILVESAPGGSGLNADLSFTAPPEIAERLLARVAALVPVRAARLVLAAPVLAA